MERLLGLQWEQTGECETEGGDPKQEMVRTRQEREDSGQTRAMTPGMGETVIPETRKRKMQRKVLLLLIKCRARPVDVP